jgi:hypothetical protein
MPTKKIADFPEMKICQSYDHNPPTMMVYPPGIYEHTCSACGYKTVFSVGAIY